MGVTMNPEERRQLVQKKAFDLYVQRGKTPGREVEDWLTAERLVERELSETAAKAAPRPEPAKEAPRPVITPIRSPSGKVGGGYKRATV